MLPILDRYLIRKFLGTFFFILAIVMAISVVFDVSERIDDFLESNATFWEIITVYYGNFVLYYGNLFSHLLIFITVIIFTSKLAQQSELISILAGGVSFNRLLRPYFISATILVIIALLLNHFVLPMSNKARIDFHVEHLWNSFKIRENNLHREIEPGVIAFAESINLEYNTAYRFSIEKWEDGKISEKIITDRAIFNPEDSSWTLRYVTHRKFFEDGEESLRREISLDTLIPVVPKDFGERPEIAATLGYNELNEYIEKEKLKGSDQVVFFEIEKHQRTSYPLATYILTLIGVSIASRKARGGIGLHIAMGFVIILIYIFVMKVSTVAATNAGVNPLISVWIPNIVFLILAILLYSKAQK
ncbi:LptF/LptG family permease [Luteibaculum oceani]|uniref:YjgP/YjgQ family permease n=1 Tax=Luteibaculum oceani TaxID=1294296 RepID=A0A5C6V8Y2_9FLAO|nr:LptF/LptG family permease [Luteibaculum oceani]TXC81547.1 YjgP/YjgQ family permease [Luteibaculum oceani]